MTSSQFQEIVARAKQGRVSPDEVAGRSGGRLSSELWPRPWGSEELRSLAGGPRVEVLAFSLRSGSVDAVPNDAPGPPRNPGFLHAKGCK